MYDIDMRNLGQCCRDIRMAAKISAEQLAKQCGIDSGPTVTRFETNQATAVTFTTLYKLLSGLAELDVVKHNDFDFGGYNPAVSKLINSFKRGETSQEYRNHKNELINYLDRNVESVPTPVLEVVTLFIQSNIDFQTQYNKLVQITNEADEHGEDISNIPFGKWLGQTLEQDGNNKAFNNTVVNMLRNKSQSSISDYTYMSLTFLHACLLASIKAKKTGKE